MRLTRLTHRKSDVFHNRLRSTSTRATSGRAIAPNIITRRHVAYWHTLRRVFHRPEPCPLAAPAAARNLPHFAALPVVFAPDLYRCRWPGQEEKEKLYC
jgi:hypothetical protein